MNSAMDLSLVSATLLGLFGGLHCIGMCGGISASLAGALPQSQSGAVGGRLRAQLGYNFGRIFSYTVAGALAGGLGLSVLALLGPGGITALRVLAGLFLVAAGLYLSGWWMGMARVEQVGARAWRHIAPFARRLGPLDRPWKLVVLGVIWGWLPCGLVYAALAGAIAAGGALEGARWMACFGLGTLPVMLTGGALSNALLGFVNRGRVRWAVGALVIGFGLWTIAAATLFGHGGVGGHASHSSIQTPSSTSRQASSQIPIPIFDSNPEFNLTPNLEPNPDPNRSRAQPSNSAARMSITELNPDRLGSRSCREALGEGICRNDLRSDRWRRSAEMICRDDLRKRSIETISGNHGMRDG